MPAVLILNPRAGGASIELARRRREQAVARLEPVGGQVFVTERRGHAFDLASHAVRDGRYPVIAWGGDGTVNEVARALAFTRTPLGIVPSGSGNGLARTLGISSDPQRAIDDALRASPWAIDAGEMGGYLFVSVAGVGFDARVAALFDANPSGRRGVASYAWIAAREFIGYESGTYRVTVPPAAPQLHSAFVMTFANASQWGNGARIAPSARVDDGWLDFVMFEERSRLATCLAVPRLFSGGIERVAGVSVRKVKEAIVDAGGEIVFHVDGEPARASGPLAVRVRPGALLVAASRRGE